MLVRKANRVDLIRLIHKVVVRNNREDPCQTASSVV